MSDKKVGRPEYVPSDEDRVRVKVLIATGMTRAAVCEAMGISKPTLLKYYTLDMDLALAKITAEVTMARYRAAIGGNIPAQNKMLEVLGAVPPKPGKAKDKAPDLGKKEAADLEAQNAHEGTDWGEVLQ